MGTQILAGQTLIADTGNGHLNQYYGSSDTTVTTVTSNAFGALSSVYTIPAGEATAGSAYRLACSGSAVWGSTQQTLFLVFWINGASTGSLQVDASSFSASGTLRWSAVLEMVSADGINSWECGLLGNINYASQVLTGLATANNTVGFADDQPVTAAVSSNITAAVGARWSSVTGAPTISCRRTTFAKIS